MQFINLWLTRGVAWLLRWMSYKTFYRVVLEQIEHRAKSLAPAEGIRFLMRLDNDLYELQGQLAIRYGEGHHPKHRYLLYPQFFAAHIQPQDRVLDLGCGTGVVDYDLVKQHPDVVVVGVDNSDHHLQIARKNHAHPRITYLYGDILGDAVTLVEGKFNVIILSNVLEHLPQRADFLRRWVQQVQPDRLLIRVPMFNRDWRVPLKQEIGIDYRLDVTHETEYTLENFRDEMNAAGLVIQHHSVQWGEIWSVVSPQ